MLSSLTCFQPTTTPTCLPSKSPSTQPSASPSSSPITSQPSKAPSTQPSASPSLSPTDAPSQSPITSSPTTSPSILPTTPPSLSPTVRPVSCFFSQISLTLLIFLIFIFSNCNPLICSFLIAMVTAHQTILTDVQIIQPRLHLAYVDVISKALQTMLHYRMR